MKALNFVKKNLLEMVRAPFIYIFCAGFPIAMMAMFAVINHFSGAASLEVFKLKSLLPGLMMFSFSFAMLVMSLTVSKDRSGAFLIRLYISPMKTGDYIIGYLVPGLIVGIAQEIVTILSGFVISRFTGEEYITVTQGLLLCAEMLPQMLFFVTLGILLGTVMNEKSAPGITSIFISGCGILGGAWMPLDTMGDFEKFCSFLPFYPGVYLGRIITGANHSIQDMMNPVVEPYIFDALAKQSVIVLAAYTVAVVVLSLVAFAQKVKKDQK